MCPGKIFIGIIILAAAFFLLWAFWPRKKDSFAEYIESSFASKTTHKPNPHFSKPTGWSDKVIEYPMDRNKQKQREDEDRRRRSSGSTGPHSRSWTDYDDGGSSSSSSSSSDSCSSSSDGGGSCGGGGD